MNNLTSWVTELEPTQYDTVSEICRDNPAVMDDYMAQLRSNPGRRLAWSKHLSRGAARQRINSLRESATFKRYPGVQFETRTTGEDAGAYILLSYQSPNNDDKTN